MASFWIDSDAVGLVDAAEEAVVGSDMGEDTALTGAGAGDGEGTQPLSVLTMQVEGDETAGRARMLASCLHQFGLAAPGLDLLDTSPAGVACSLDAMQGVLEAYQGLLEEGKARTEEIATARAALSVQKSAASMASRESKSRGEALTRLEATLETTQSKLRSAIKAHKKAASELLRVKSEKATAAAQYKAERTRLDKEMDKLRSQIKRLMTRGGSAGAGGRAGRRGPGARKGAKQQRPPAGVTGFLPPAPVSHAGEGSAAASRLTAQLAAQAQAEAATAHETNTRLRNSLRKIHAMLLDVFEVDELEVSDGPEGDGRTAVRVDDLFGVGDYSDEAAFAAEGIIEGKIEWLGSLVRRASSYELLKLKSQDDEATAAAEAAGEARAQAQLCAAHTRIAALEAAFAATAGDMAQPHDCMNLSGLAAAEQELTFREAAVAEREREIAASASAAAVQAAAVQRRVHEATAVKSFVERSRRPVFGEVTNIVAGC